MADNPNAMRNTPYPPIDKAFIANPYPHYRRWLDGPRVFWHPDFFGGSWVITRHADVIALLRDLDNISTEKTGSLVTQFPPEYHDELRDIDLYLARWLAFIDPPKHNQLRRLLRKGFTPQVVNSFRPRVQQITDELLDKAVAQSNGSGEIDLVRDFAYQLPVRVVSAMLGAPDEDHPQFMQWMDDLAMFLGNANPTVEVARKAKQALYSLTEYFRQLTPARRANPGDDLISILLSAEEDGVGLSEEELYAQCVFFLFAGHETTSNLIANAMYCLLRFPDEMARVRENLSLVPSMIEEALRYEGPMQYTFRLARRDFDLFGQPVKKGDVLVVVFGAANRDPAVFDDPDRFDATRHPNPHLTFGYGLQKCLGAGTARMEADIAFTTLLRRFPRIELLEPPEWTDVYRFRGLKRLKIKVDREATGR